MSNTARTNTKKTEKFYDSMNINDWNLNFEYETINGVLSKKILVQGTKENGTVFINKQDNNLNVVFTNGNYDIAVVNAVVSELGVLETDFPEVPAT
jgi:uncharacterized protein YaeQ